MLLGAGGWPKVTDVQDFYSGQVMPSYDPQIFICYAVQAGCMFHLVHDPS